MVQPKVGDPVAPFKMRTSQLLMQIRKLAEDSGNVSWSLHALERMEERDISTLDALRVLRLGDIKGEIKAGSKAGEWKCKVVANRKGSRDIGVVTLVLRTGRLFVKTVEWEDT